MGKPGRGHARSSRREFIAAGSERGEVKHLSTRRKRNYRDSLSSGERTGISPNQDHSGGPGVVGRQRGVEQIGEVPWNGAQYKVRAL